MHPLARGRLTGYLLDCTGYLGIAAAVLPIGTIVHLTTDLGQNRLYAHIVSAVPPAIATLVAARAEAGPHRATWGKRRRGLQVGRAAGGAATTRALVRNTLKIFVPWQLGHTTAIGAVFGGFEDRDPVTITATVLTYAVIGAFAATTLRGTGRGPHDLAAGTIVTRAAATAARSR